MQPEVAGKGDPVFGGDVSRPLLPTRAGRGAWGRGLGPAGLTAGWRLGLACLVLAGVGLQTHLGTTREQPGRPQPSCPPAFGRACLQAPPHRRGRPAGARVVRRGASARGDGLGPGSALTSCRRCSFLSCAISRVRLVSTSRRRCCSSRICFIRATCVCVWGYGCEAGAVPRGLSPLSTELQADPPPGQAPKRNGLTASLAVQVSPCSRVQHAPMALVTAPGGPTWSHRQGPAGVGPACMAGAR